MKPVLLSAALAAVGNAVLVNACGGHGHGHDHDKEFSPEELAELERKWGFEVCMHERRTHKLTAPGY